MDIRFLLKNLIPGNIEDEENVWSLLRKYDLKT